MFKIPMADLPDKIPQLLRAAFSKRKPLFSDPDTDAFRLYNGFFEGCPFFSIDRYGGTAVILWQSKQIKPEADLLKMIIDSCVDELPGIGCVLLKNRWAADDAGKKGIICTGREPEGRIREWGVSYAVDLQVNKDCGFYLDSSLLRKWLIENASGKRVLNTFAYTGSLGDAAEAGGALSVTQTDLNHNYLLSRHSSQEYIIGDFFGTAARLRRSGRLFDLIILDPPFFARAGRGAGIDLARNTAGLINKIRPLAAHGGKIIAVNNALFLSGKEYLRQIEAICGDCLSVSGIIPVPDSFFGFSAVDGGHLPADPGPFNHSTKIIVLDIIRKDERK